MKKVLVLFGGVSSEHDVSLISAKSVIENIPSDKYEVTKLGITKDGVWYIYKGDTADLPGDRWLENRSMLVRAVLSPDRSHHGVITERGSVISFDICFPVLHGRNGEDGTVQGLLALAGIPFVGCDMLSSAVCMDKAMTNAIADYAGIKQAKWMAFDKYAYSKDAAQIIKKAENSLGFPIFVKPANSGSSVGITKVSGREALESAINTAFEFDKKVVIEEGIDGHEVECAVMGNDEPVASTVGEIVPCNEFYDYDAKYYANRSELNIPANLPEQTIQAVRDAACRAYKAFGCSGLTRIDFFVRKSDGAVMLNEPNTIPGFTSISMYPKLFEASGVPYPELLDRLLQLAEEKTV